MSGCIGEDNSVGDDDGVGYDDYETVTVGTTRTSSETSATATATATTTKSYLEVEWDYYSSTIWWYVMGVFGLLGVRWVANFLFSFFI